MRLSCSGRCPRLDHRNEAKTTGEPVEICVNRVLPWRAIWREGTDEGRASFLASGELSFSFSFLNGSTSFTVRSS